MPAQFQPQSLSDSLFSFEAGMNQGVAPLLLPKNQLAMATNCTVRGTFVRPRPPFRKMTLDFGGDAVLQQRFTKANWQGGGYYKPDNGNEKLCAVIGGRFFTATPTGGVATVSEPPVDAGSPPLPYPRPAAQRQAWLWQSEKWMNWNDGISPCVFFDDVDLAQSNFGVPTPMAPTAFTADWTVTPIGALTAAQPVAAVVGIVVGDIITVKDGVHGIGTVQVAAVGVGTIDFVNLTCIPLGRVVAFATSTLSWSHQGTQLPPGRMGTYGMGRNWVSLIDGKQFIASDLVGGSSGTQAENYRDAVLQVTENLYLAGGGNFTVPGSVGDIKAMRFTATLDASLGQGPLQVFTPNTVFSCNAPVDRLTWQDITNPILTESLISNGALSQNATVNANGDLTFRSLDGLRSLILGRRDFATFGNVPMSREVDQLMRLDPDSVLPFTSAVIFDNRLLLTVGAVTDPMGVYFRGMVALNFDPISSLRGKAPSVYDGLWTGLNVLQLIVGEFQGNERCFAFTLNKFSDEIELYEILTDGDGYLDNGNKRIVWSFETPILDFGQKDPRKREQLRLRDGEVHIDELKGLVDFQVYYRPDQWPCWVPWFAWQECALAPDATKPETANYRPQFRPSMGLGEPSPVPCDETNNRPLREGYSYQLKFVITGECRFLGGRYEAYTVPTPSYAKQTCCQPRYTGTFTSGGAAGGGGGGGNPNLPPPVVPPVTKLTIDAFTQNDGSVAPIILTSPPPAGFVVGAYGRVNNVNDMQWYEIVAYQLNDGSVVPILDQTPYPNNGGNAANRALNVSDGFYYDLLATTLNDGSIVPICDQTPHATP